MSGVFSIASHWALQYLPDDVMHEQTGCAHFLTVSLVIIVSPSFGSDRATQDGMVKQRQEALLYRSGHY